MADPSDARINSYWHTLRLQAERGVARAGAAVHYLVVAGHPVTLQFADADLAPLLLPALSHLAGDDAADPALTAMLLNGGAGGQDPPPPPPWTVAPGEAWKLQTRELAALHLPALGSVLWFDRAARVAACWLPAPAEVPIAERGSPLLTLWDWWLADLNLQLTHAAAVGTSAGAALLVGPGGSGKSTTALTCLGASRLRYLADDYCIVAPDHTKPSVHSLFCSGKVNLSGEARVAHLSQCQVGSDGEKGLYVFHPAAADHLAREMPIRAILVPTITGRPETTMVPLSPMDAIRAVAPSTVLQLRTGTDPAAALRRLADVARRVPCYRLDLGTELDRIPPVIAHLLG